MKFTFSRANSGVSEADYLALLFFVYRLYCEQYDRHFVQEEKHQKHRHSTYPILIIFN